ncbi:MAG: TrpR-like protein [Oscillospiraceae bacterium]|jgi:TrpR-related protein YerC/YecD|nr:TrpR-like protein [Oscillospiraceae bacterium]MCI9588682.1 TrpR-like protein [Oscillospiraceae bacterium]
MDLFSHRGTDLLVRAFLSLETEEECRALLEDLLTTREVLDLSQRLLVARLLDRQMVYSEIVRETGASSATISRVNRCYTYGAGGYTTILPRIAEAGDSEAEEPTP